MAVHRNTDAEMQLNTLLKQFFRIVTALHYGRKIGQIDTTHPN